MDWKPIVISRAGSCPADDAMCEGISPLGYWQEVNQSPTQTKPYNTLPPYEYEQRDFGLRMGPYVPTPKFFTFSGDPGRVIYRIHDMRKFTFL